MRNRFVVGLFTTAALFFAAPVVAEERVTQQPSLTADIEEIQDMVKRSQERQGSVQKTQEVESEPSSTISGQAKDLELVIEPISPITAPNSTSTVTVSVHTKSAKNTAQFQARSTFHNQLNYLTTPTTPVPSTVSANQALSEESHSQKKVHQSSQEIAIRHANRHRHQSASDEPPSATNAMKQEEPTREQQLNHKGFMLFATDLAWERVDTKHDYALGARLEIGVISPLAAIRVYAPDKLPEAIAILSGQKDYT